MNHRFDIEVTPQLEKGVSEMCNLTHMPERPLRGSWQRSCLKGQLFLFTALINVNQTKNKKAAAQSAMLRAVVLYCLECMG